MKTTLIICIFALSFGTLHKSKAIELSTKAILTDSIKTDPICKMKVKQNANYKSIYQKQEYLFCSKGCKLKFDQNPEKYLKK